MKRIVVTSSCGTILQPGPEPSYYTAEDWATSPVKEVEEKKARDPIGLLAALLRERGGMAEAEVDEMEAAVKAEVQDAWDFAESSPDPDPAELFTDVYAPEA